MTTFTIKQFSVLDTSTGKMSVSGRYAVSMVDTILSHRTIINGETEQIPVPGAPTTITVDSALYNKAHMCTGYIQLIKNFAKTLAGDAIFVPDRQIRICYLGGITSAKNSIIYGFAPSNSTPPANIVWNALMAVTTEQTKGDYWDITIPDETFLPNPYLAIILLNNAWSSRTIIADNVCSMSDALPNFCINPSHSATEAGVPHFIQSQGYNSFCGMLTRVIISAEDWYVANTDNDYNDVIISVASKLNSELQINDTHLS